MLGRYYLQLGAETVTVGSDGCIDVSDMLANLKDIQMSYSRVDLGGVVRKCGSTLELTGDARERIISLYEQNSLSSLASFAVFSIENDWTFTKIFECPLDFSSFKYDSYRAEIGCLDNSAAAVIKANKSTKYDYSVEEISSTKTLKYDGVSIRNEETLSVTGQQDEGSTYQTIMLEELDWWLIPPVYVNSENEGEYKNFLIQDQQESHIKGQWADANSPENTCTTSWFLECLSDNSLINIEISARTFSGFRNYYTYLYKISSDGSLIRLASASDNATDKWDSLKWSGVMNSGEKLQIAILDPQGSHNLQGYEIRFDYINVSLSWNERGEPINISVVEPVTFLQRLLDSMNGKQGLYADIKDTVIESGVEEENTRLKHSVLVAAESIRNFSNAKITSSFSDFCDWMESVFGYIYVIEDRVLFSAEYNDIESNIVDFGGFVDYKNMDDAEETTSLPYFSNTDGVFLKATVVPGVQEPAWRASFDGNEDYQTEDMAFYKVRTDRYYCNKENNILYSATLEAKEIDDGIRRWFATLNEYVHGEVSDGDYSGILPFGGIVNLVSKDSGVYNGSVSPDNIVYVRQDRRFYYLSEGMYYSAFAGYSSYNKNNAARPEYIYQYGQKTYILIGESLVECTVKSSGSSNKVPFVVFKHRDEVFGRGSVKTIKSVSEPQYSVASDRIYSSIQIGYSKQDYDLGNNGKDEFNFTVNYTTGVLLSDKQLSMLSPYRADCYGFEELVGKRGEDTSSSDSDEQIFAVMCHLEDSVYIIDREIAIEGSYSDTVFNAGYAPVYMVEANKRYLASFTDELKFASTTGSSGISLDGKKVIDDIMLDSPLLGPGNLSFQTDNYLIPEEWNETLVKIEWNGKTYTGCLGNLDYSTSRENAFEYELIETD